MQKLSVIIPTFNETLHIEGVLESVQWADEIIVVDSFSTDNTLQLAAKYTDKLLQRTYTGPADQKNWTIPQASHEWILLLDADERCTEGLKTEVQDWLKKEIPYDAFWIPRQNFFMGKAINYSGWQGDAVVRFFHRDRCRYNDKQVHEEIETKGIKVSRLKHKLLHYTYKDIDHFLDKMRRYAKWSAQDHAHKTPHVGFFHLFFKPLFRFFKHFIWQLGFLDGFRGLVVSIIMAWGVFLRYLYLTEERTIMEKKHDI
jgi:glycosyltransferase involved in cell wall biosynthesis